MFRVEVGMGGMTSSMYISDQVGLGILRIGVVSLRGIVFSTDSSVSELSGDGDADCSSDDSSTDSSETDCGDFCFLPFLIPMTGRCALSLSLEGCLSLVCVGVGFLSFTCFLGCRTLGGGGGGGLRSGGAGGTSSRSAAGKRSSPCR